MKFVVSIANHPACVLVSGGMAVGAAMSSRTPMAFAAGAQLNLNFESGSLGSPITRREGASLAPFARSGAYDRRLNPAGTHSRLGYLVVDRRGFTLNRPYATYSMYQRLMSAPKGSNTYMNPFEIGAPAPPREFLHGNVKAVTPDETLTARLRRSYSDYIEGGSLTNPNVNVNVRIEEAANGKGWLGPAS